MPTFRLDNGKEYDSIVKARKGALDFLKKKGYMGRMYVYRHSKRYGDKWYSVGDVYWPGEGYYPIYTETIEDVCPKGWVKGETYVLKMDGSIKSTLATENAHRQRLWKKRYNS